MGTYKILDDYTADIGIEIEANDLEDLVATLIKAFNDLVFQDEFKVHEKETVETFSYNYDNGLFVIDVLNDLIYILETKNLVPIRVKEVKLDDNKVVITLIFKKYLSKPSIQLKAATYHDFYFHKNNSIRTRIVFDL